MGLTRRAAEIWRKYVTAGVPASGFHEPDQDEIVQWGTELEELLYVLGDTPYEVTTAGPIALPASTVVVVINRNNPAATELVLESIAARGGLPLYVIDLSTAVVNHVITMTPNGTDKIMRRNSWQLVSVADQLQVARFAPLATYSNWIII